MDIPEELRGKAVVDLPTAARLLGISKNSAYKAARAGELPHLKLGSRFVVPVAPLVRMLGLTELPVDEPERVAAA